MENGVIITNCNKLQSQCFLVYDHFPKDAVQAGAIIHKFVKIQPPYTLCTHIIKCPGGRHRPERLAIIFIKKNLIF